jgi:hypothetical protein
MEYSVSPYGRAEPEDENTLETQEGRQYKPTGIRFAPTIEEIANYFLTPEGEADRKTWALDFDIFSTDPTVLLLLHSNYYFPKAWFVTNRENARYDHGVNKNRTTPRGYWKGTGKTLSRVVGQKVLSIRLFVYYQGVSTMGGGIRTNWKLRLMQLKGDEYPDYMALVRLETAARRAVPSEAAIPECVTTPLPDVTSGESSSEGLTDLPTMEDSGDWFDIYS